MSKELPRFIIVDHDKVNNMLYSRIIKSSLGDVRMETFQIASEALKYIKSEYSHTQDGYAILFLEIDMPELQSWKFLEKFAKLNKKVKGHIRIIILSSSFDARVKEKALKNKNVSQFIIKPITREFIEKMF